MQRGHVTAEDLRYRERVNGRLKDEFGARHVRVRGKVLCHMMFGAGVNVNRRSVAVAAELRPTPQPQPAEASDDSQPVPRHICPARRNSCRIAYRLWSIWIATAVPPR